MPSSVGGLEQGATHLPNCLDPWALWIQSLGLVGHNSSVQGSEVRLSNPNYVLCGSAQAVTACPTTQAAEALH